MASMVERGLRKPQSLPLGEFVPASKLIVALTTDGSISQNTISLSLSLSLYPCMYIYIYRERERDYIIIMFIIKLISRAHGRFNEASPPGSWPGQVDLFLPRSVFVDLLM